MFSSVRSIFELLSSSVSCLIIGSLSTLMEIGDRTVIGSASKRLLKKSRFWRRCPLPARKRILSPLALPPPAAFHHGAGFMSVVRRTPANRASVGFHPAEEQLAATLRHTQDSRRNPSGTAKPCRTDFSGEFVLAIYVAVSCRPAGLKPNGNDCIRKSCILAIREKRQKKFCPLRESMGISIMQG